MDRDLVDAVADARGEDADEVDKAGADTAAEHRRTTARARVDDALTIVAQRVAIDERGGADDVHTGLEDADELVDVGPHRVVDDAVGPEREEGVDVVRRGDTDGIDPAQLADVDARPCPATTRSNPPARGRGWRRRHARTAGRRCRSSTARHEWSLRASIRSGWRRSRTHGVRMLGSCTAFDQGDVEWVSSTARSR